MARVTFWSVDTLERLFSYLRIATLFSPCFFCNSQYDLHSFCAIGSDFWLHRWQSRVQCLLDDNGCPCNSWISRSPCFHFHRSVGADGQCHLCVATIMLRCPELTEVTVEPETSGSTLSKTATELFFSLRYFCWCKILVSVKLNVRFTTIGMCVKHNIHIYVARTSNNRVISTALPRWLLLILVNLFDCLLQSRICLIRHHKGKRKKVTI